MKKGLMVATLGVLILSFTIVGVQAGKAWQIPSPTLKNPVTIDGKWTDPNEWADGYPMNCGGYGWIVVKSDSSFLYVMVDFIKDFGIQAEKYAWVEWDQKNDGGSKPRTDDYELVINHTSTTSVALRISQGTGSGWTNRELASFPGVSGDSTDNAMNDPYSAVPHVIYEIKIPRTMLDNSTGTVPIGFLAGAVSTGGWIASVPTGDREVPDTWNSLTFSTQVQPLYGGSWPSTQILVFIKPVGQVSGQASVSAAYARQAVLDAMNTWNLAQRWFRDTYMGGKGYPYTFKETDIAPTSGVVISFNQTQTSDNWGWTNFPYYWDGSGRIYKVSATTSLILTWYNGSAVSQSVMEAVTTHELGHALGLDHTTFSMVDLMNHLSSGYGVNLPSTLNLYAVYLLSKTNNVHSQPSSPVSLPPNIPYAETPQTAVPEFNSIAPILLVVVLSFMGFSCRQISRRRSTTSTYP